MILLMNIDKYLSDEMWCVKEKEEDEKKKVSHGLVN